MREVNVEQIRDVVAQLCIKACVEVPCDIRSCMENALEKESGIAREILQDMLKNQDIAKTDRLPICQDTGMVMVFLDVGQDMRIVGGDVEDAINAGVRKGYEEGYLRKSVVGDPIRRTNTGDNTPAIIHYQIVPGDRLHITVSPKGFGSENMSRLKMFVPGVGIDGVRDFVMETVKLADSNACPPIIVGVGVGGSFDKSALMAKRALLRPLGQPHPDPYWAGIEAELLERINATGIGPSGLGGKTTAMAVHINTFATHIAGLPVAVNIGCHVNRHEEAVL
ncbi:MAG: fumarate hydratase [Defluviitaleaceae bacterium]|nr:fumarate hydratase [Defluviitaleaceae bacterium]